MNCTDKIRHATMLDAQTAADAYHGAIALTFYPMTPYFCWDHTCWHIGHDRRFPVDLRNSYAIDSAQRHLARMESDAVDWRAIHMINIVNIMDNAEIYAAA